MYMGECIVHTSGRVCNGGGVRNYSTWSNSPDSLALWGGCEGRSQQIYAPLGRRRPLQNEMTSRVL